jgi:outer membrane protein insertion porin family
MINFVRSFFMMNIRKITMPLLVIAVLFCINTCSYAVFIGTTEAKPSFGMQKKVNVNQLVTSIVIKGNRTVTEDIVMDAVFSRVGDILIEEKVQSDLKSIYSTGYFQDVTASFESYGGGTKIIYNLVENPILANVVFIGNTVYSSDTLMSVMKTQSGKTLNYKTLQEDIQVINDKYHNDGYSIARIADVQTDPKTNVLKLKIVEGMIESIALTGNEVTRDYVILREIDTRPGQVLNEKSLSKDLRRVFNLGYFSEIKPNFEPGSSPDKVILVVDVKETKSSTINFGGGYGEREGWFGFTDLNINNLFGTGHNTMLRGQWGQTLTTYQIKYYYPWFMTDIFGARTSLTSRIWNTSGPDVYGNEIQDALRVGWDMALARPFAENWSHAFSFGSENVTPNYDTTVTDAVSFEPYVSDFVGYSVSYDTRDYFMNPTEGEFCTLSLRRGWKQTDHITNFTKLGLDLNKFIKLGTNQVLALHAGTGLGYGDVPLGELYWCGGANTVRGYFPSEALLGVRKLIFNMEYRYTFNDMFQGVAFYDFGDAWGDVENESAKAGGIDFSQFMSGRGLGLRLNTPMGPIRLDYGIGDSRSFGEGIIHFSIGQAF